MPYASVEDLIAAAGGQSRFNQMVDREPAESWAGEPREYWIAYAQKRGDALVDSYLAARYRTRLTRAGYNIVAIAADEGIYQLAKSAGMLTEDDREAAQLRITQLKDMRDGKQWPADPLPASTRARQSAFVENTRRVSRKKLDGFV